MRPLQRLDATPSWCVESGKTAAKGTKPNPYQDRI
jgi:hypothetical protein